MQGVGEVVEDVHVEDDKAGKEGAPRRNEAQDDRQHDQEPLAERQGDGLRGVAEDGQPTGRARERRDGGGRAGGGERTMNSDGSASVCLLKKKVTYNLHRRDQQLNPNVR